MTRQVRLTAEQVKAWQAKIQAQKLRAGGRATTGNVPSSSQNRNAMGVRTNELSKDVLPVRQKKIVDPGGTVDVLGGVVKRGSMAQRFFIPGPLPGANDTIRKHHMVYSRLKSQWGLTIARCIIVSKLKRMGYCSILFRWQEPNNKRDDDNVIFAQKFVLDALRDTKIIPDDRRQFIKSLSHCVVVDKESPGVWVELVEV